MEPDVEIQKRALPQTPAPEPAREYLITVSIAGLQVSNDPLGVLVTYALGSCIGLAAHDAALGVGALMHVMLPVSHTHVEGAWARPAMFVDTGLPILLGRMAQLGCTPQSLIVKIAGGGQLLSASKQLALGTRNIEAMRAACAAHGLFIAAEDVGGTKSRNLTLHVGSGRVVVSSCGEERAL